MRVKIAITDRFHGTALQLLQSHPQVELVTIGAMPTTSEMKEIEGLIIRSRTTVNRDLLSQLPNLKFIVSTTSGFDHIDLKTAQERKIVVMYTPEAHAASVAELTFLLLLGVCRKVNQVQTDLRQGLWRSPRRLPSSLLNGKTMGIVGLGRIGQRVARIATSFGLNVLACDPYQEDQTFADLRLSRMSYEEIARMSDILSFHVPLTPKTKFMFNSDVLECVHEGLVLINTCRGAVVQESALVDGLRSGIIAGAGLDVFEIEPVKKESQLLKFEQLFLTPHIGAFSEDAFAWASLEGAKKTIAWVERGESSDTLPPTTEWYRDGFEKS